MKAPIVSSLIFCSFTRESRPFAGDLHRGGTKEALERRVRMFTVTETSLRRYGGLATMEPVVQSLFGQHVMDVLANVVGGQFFQL
ncbi:hypothetical protein FHR92_004649 [Fontibacillus solani]|uniref:Uncharacterized protein n=1 Tax=Fontibacillus solani TaxID=1572857 RepID=A0A7W3SXW8_9BACL|nr:hypothetical protein [Fontibacillus solani]MBA9088153.1 hypothetical protein [Fontibacillus solani]